MKRAAATAGYIYSDKSLHTLKSLSEVYLFKRQQTQLNNAGDNNHILFTVVLLDDAKVIKLNLSGLSLL